MSRPLRIEFAGALYNVTSRQDGQEVIILGEEDRRRFLDVLSELVHDFNWAVHAYCLMNNHYHLLIDTLEGNLSGDSLKETADHCRVHYSRVHRIVKQQPLTRKKT